MSLHWVPLVSIPLLIVFDLAFEKLPEGRELLFVLGSLFVTLWDPKPRATMCFLKKLRSYAESL